jgi:hypothetical protein
VSQTRIRKLQSLLKVESVVEFSQLQAVLGGVSRATVFRYLAQVEYRRSYNFNGRFYTRHDPQRYDSRGLYSFKGIHFSRDGSLSETVIRLVCESIAGQTQRELQDFLQVRAQSVLLESVRQNKITREDFQGLYLYLHPDEKLRSAQLTRRREMLEAQRFEAQEVTDQVVIEVLLVLIRYPGSRPGDVARRLKGRQPPITLQHVQVVFDRYNLDAVGEKGGPSQR